MSPLPPLVSIGLPVFNGDTYLEQAIESILAQTWGNFELIISDNASTDRTQEICLVYKQRDPRVRYVRNGENRGAAFNYNQTVELARGQFFKWAAADDWIAPTFLESCLISLQSDQSVVLAYPHTQIVDESGQPLSLYEDDLDLPEEDPAERFCRFLERFRRKDKCNAVFGLIRMDQLRKTRLIDRFTSSDITLLGELALLGKFVEIPQVLFFRRDHPASSVRAFKPTERAVWFDPALKQPRCYVHWRLWGEFMRSLWRLPLPLVMRLKAMRGIVRWGMWRRKLLVLEARSWIGNNVRSLPRPIYIFLRRVWH
ncbi:MAG: glycosyltransferase family 2 protein [Thermanaerothrix sp.]|nr:glycosyltransferase family 2 protein [Thermanaerothrix sp.]